MLNGSHSFLAYLGYLSGFAHISDCMQDRAFRHAARTLMLDEQAPTLRIKDVDLTQYADKLIARFANPALKHKTWQIAMDGSQKLPQRMLAGIRIHLGRETDWSLLALGVAGWMRYVSGVDDAGNAIDVRDPLSDKIRELVAGSSSEQRVTALLSLREIFGDDLPDNPHFVRTSLATNRTIRRASGAIKHPQNLTISAVKADEARLRPLSPSLFCLF